jgi:hypothetical protein
MLTCCFVTGTSLASLFHSFHPATVSLIRGGKGNNRFYSAKTFCPFFVAFSWLQKLRPSVFSKTGTTFLAVNVRLLLPPILSMNTVSICGCKSNRLFHSPKTFNAFFLFFSEP